MSYGLGSIHSAPASMQNTFEIQSRMPPQPLPMSAAPIMANFSTNMIGQGPQPWINPSMIPATTQNTPMMTPVRKYSLDQNPSPALLTSAFAPSGSCMPSVLGHPQTNNHMFTPIEANAGAQGFHLLPNSAPANLSSSFVNHQAQNMIASTPTRVNKGLPVAGGNTVSMMAATASSAGDEDTGKTPKTVKRKRKADEGVPTLGISDLYAQAHFDHVEGNVGYVSSASVSTPVRERKPLPKRLPPSAFQKTEAGLPFPIVDTSAKHSTEFIYPDCTGLSKREARLVRNRAAAFLSRQRKREQHEELEVRCHALSRLVWHMYGNMMGNTEVPWDEAALRMGLTLPSSSSSGSGPSAMNGMQQQPQAPQELGLKLREEARTVLTAFEMVVKRKGATIGPLEGELPFEQGPPLGAAAAYVPSQTNGEPRLVNMLAEYGGGGDVEFDTDSDEQLQAQQQQQVQGDSSATPQRRRTR
ncbi:unnamed protein product [Tilletia controversa]|nr:unnamed protein product [Tilletia controversa]